MKVYIQSNKNLLPHNYNFFNAYQGFYEMGFETVMFHTYEELEKIKLGDFIIVCNYEQLYCHPER